ncbi:MAG: hypothetical protein KJP14_07370 [Eudoraea sp.]|nr:hypothetical protein [Eudoraea sp.]MBT8210330.1 hypothetical protein [Eudoraea sp.]MBT8312779.1 hypothetical protein [Eudoraea sp.]NNJ39193.1 hypothetical protein [Flavobacteriaceae bacterium]
MITNDKLIATRVVVGLICIAVFTVALVLYHEYVDSIYREVEQVLGSSMQNMDNTLAGE